VCRILTSRRNLLKAGFKVKQLGWSPRDFHKIEIESIDSIDTFASLASYTTGTVGDFPGVRRPGRETDHSPASTAEVKNDEAMPPFTYIFMA
jgi:hypothetical protein